jgi:tetratricopeptide (TPR) repeat protein
VPNVAGSSFELELDRIRQWSRCGRHCEALAAAELLEATAPGDRDVLYLIAANQRCLERIPEAMTTLWRLARQHPRFSLVHQELGYCFMHRRDARRAIAAFRQAVAINPALAASWFMLETLCRLAGDEKNRQIAAEQISTLAAMPFQVVHAWSRFSDGNSPAAEASLRRYLLEGGDHVEAMRLLARIEQQRGAIDAAESRLQAALARDPSCRAARLDYIRVLIDRQKYLAARQQTDALLALEHGDRESLSLSATACVGLGDYHRAIAEYRQLLDAPGAPAELHLELGHCLRAIGRSQDAAECYRAAAAEAGVGDAYWSLANLKTYQFSDAEIAQMRAAEDAPAALPADRCHLCFALGRALEDRHEYAESWRFYERGNALKRAASGYRPEFIESDARRQAEVCTAAFFAARTGAGMPDRDPIFVVGLPRSGSTLIEQILASHSQVEGTHELAEVQRIVFEMRADQSNPDNPGYPGVLTELAAGEFRRLGERYLNDTRAYRSGKPFFIDKMPNNFRHIGLIHLMLPNARIIDVRREPMACCVGNLKQLFARGQEFAYSVEDIARYYRTYLDLMRHCDMVLPGRVLRVWLEDVVQDLESHVRRVLTFCGLRFEAACLEFHRTERSIRTASSEQVRRPIFRDGLFQWRNYDPWLGPLKDALGDALVRFRE